MSVLYSARQFRNQIKRDIIQEDINNSEKNFFNSNQQNASI